jgi:hypothetical protein
MKFTGKTYNSLKFVAMILLPAVGSAYFSLAAIWFLPAADEVVGTITVVDTLLGILLGISTAQYNKTVNVPDGELLVSEVDGEKYLSLGVSGRVEDLTSKGEVRLRVVPHTSGLSE